MAELKQQEKQERLPAEYVAGALQKEQSIFLNVAKFEFAQRVAAMFANSTMVPQHFQGSAANCMIALNYADRINADPFLTMQNIYIVHGRPGVEAKLVIALINQSNKYSEPLKYKLDGQGEEYGCTAWTRDAKSGEVVEGPKVTWKIVKAEGWDQNKGSQKSKWATMPEMMFRYRAASYFANVHCPELRLGMHTVEELEDTVEMVSSHPGEWHKVQEQTESAAGALAGQMRESNEAQERESSPQDALRQRLEKARRRVAENDARAAQDEPKPEPGSKAPPNGNGATSAKQAPNQAGPAKEVEEYQKLRAEFINLRSPESLATFVFKNRVWIVNNYPPALLGELRDKWYRIVTDGANFPLDSVEEEQAVVPCAEREGTMKPSFCAKCQDAPTCKSYAEYCGYKLCPDKGPVPSAECDQCESREGCPAWD